MFAIQTQFVHQVPCSELYLCTSTPYLQMQTTLEETGGTKETTWQLTLSQARKQACTHTHT